jgi:hypothetical protein
MQLINRNYVILIVALFYTPTSAYAESWSCSSGNDVREIHIERTGSAPVPCSVIYRKQTEGIEDQVLWSANHDESFCDEKATALVAELDSSGWVCTETIRDSAD